MSPFAAIDEVLVLVERDDQGEVRVRRRSGDDFDIPEHVSIVIARVRSVSKLLRALKRPVGDRADERGVATIPRDRPADQGKRRNSEAEQC